MSVEEDNEKLSLPKKPRFVRVLDEAGNLVPRFHKAKVKNFDAIAVLVVDRNDRVLRALEWDISKLERDLTLASEKGASDIEIAMELGRVGVDAGELVNREIRDALVRRDKARKKSRKK